MKTLRQFFVFLLAGGVGLLVTLGVTYLLTEGLHWWYLWSYCIATLCGWTSSFFINSLATFAGHAKKRYGRTYLIFLSIYVATFMLNSALVYVLTSKVGLYYLLSIIIASVVTTLITFSLSKKVIFTFEEHAQQD